MNIEIALFDFDGTIMDSVEVVRGATREIFQKSGKEFPPIEEHLGKKNENLADFYKRYKIDISKEELESTFESYYKEHAVDKALFPRTRLLFEYLKEKKIVVGLITMQKHNLVAPLLDKFSLIDYFKHFEFGAKNKTTAIKRILKDEKMKPEKCFYVGDTPSDTCQANKAGVVSVAVERGHLSKQVLLEASPTYLISDIVEILRII